MVSVKRHVSAVTQDLQHVVLLHKAMLGDWCLTTIRGWIICCMVPLVEHWVEAIAHSTVSNSSKSTAAAAAAANMCNTRSPAAHPQQ
jgi:hypothetical protein